MSENKYNIKVGIYNGGRAEWSEAPIILGVWVYRNFQIQSLNPKKKEEAFQEVAKEI